MGKQRAPQRRRTLVVREYAFAEMKCGCGLRSWLKRGVMPAPCACGNLCSETGRYAEAIPHARLMLPIKYG